MSMSMNSPIKTAGGTCPHGMPMGACPLCNGMGGGGASTRKPAVKEMSWDECYAIGQMLKANKAGVKDANKDINALQTGIMAQVANAIVQRIANVQAFIMNNIVTPVVTTVKNVVAKVFSPIANVLGNISTMAQKAFNAVKEQLINIMDKLTAIFGEQQKAVEKFFSDNFKKVKKGFLSFFGIDTQMEQGDEEEELELKRITDIEKLKEQINKIFKKDKED